MIKQQDVDNYFSSICSKRQNAKEDKHEEEGQLVPGADLSTDDMYQSLQNQDDSELSPRSLKNKEILTNIKESEVKIKESLKKITDIQKKLSDRNSDSMMPNFNQGQRQGQGLKQKNPEENINPDLDHVEDLELKQQVRFASCSLPDFGQMVKSQLRKRFNAEISHDHCCDVCYQSFQFEWELSKHLSKCKRPDRGSTCFQVNGSYSCLICAHDSGSRDDLKKHLFYNHAEVDILSKYGQPFQRLVGGKMHSRLRMPMLTRIGSGKFDKAIQTMVEKVDKFEISSLDFIFPYEIDEDPINKSRRKLIYFQKREILTKIATLSKEASLTILTDDEDQDQCRPQNQQTWDLSIDVRKEWIPDQVIRTLRFTIMALRKKIASIPSFFEFYKDGNMVMVKYSHQPIRLRSIIGRRNEMYLKGSKIIKLLLMGLLELKEHGVKVYNIEPSSIYLNDDYSKLVFADIRHMASNDEKKCPVITTKPPYCGLFGLLKEREHWETQARDMYSIGVVILEIIVGTELAIMTKRPLGLTKLLSDLIDYVDKDTMALLNYLILDKDEVDLKVFIQSHLSQGNDKIKEAIIRVKHAADIDQNFKQMTESFEIFMQYHAAACYEDYRLLSIEIVNKICKDKIEIKEKK